MDLASARVLQTDIAIIGGGGAGLRAAIAAAEINPSARISLVSKVYPMRSHTVTAEGGAAGVIRDDDSLQDHFHDTVSGGEWLCDQDVVDFFVEAAAREMVDLERRGCPWSRRPDGQVATRAFGGMNKERSWYAADKTGFHILHTLFQNSLQYPSIQRYDEFYTLDILTDGDRVYGVVTINIPTGELIVFQAPNVILATGGAGRIFPFTTNGAIKTGDGMAMALRAGVALQDMEFIQYHPTGLPGSGILITEGSRGEGGILVNKDGYRYLQDYELGPPDPWPRKRAMELGPRDRISQAFYHEEQKGRTIESPEGNVVHLDLRHLGEALIKSRLPFIRELAMKYAGIDPVVQPIPVRPVVHYTMGGVKTNIDARTSLRGLFAAGEVASCGLHGANRLGSNSLAELCVFGRVAGEHAARESEGLERPGDGKMLELAEASSGSFLRQLFVGERPQPKGSLALLRNRMQNAMERGGGIYRSQDSLAESLREVNEVRSMIQNLTLNDHSRAFNTELIAALELRNQADVALCVLESSHARQESRGAHQRLDYPQRNDEEYLKHTLIFLDDGKPTVSFTPVTITHSRPGERSYGK